MLDLSAAAHRVTANFIAELGVDPRELRELLAEDLESRVESLQDDVRFLEQGNVPPDKFIQGVELWSRYGADEELLELQQQFDPFAMTEESGFSEHSEEMMARAQAALARYRERMDELEREHQQRVSLDLIDEATRVATRLRRVSDTSRILTMYHVLDEPLTELEGYVHEAVLALDREIQHQIDLARGK